MTQSTEYGIGSVRYYVDTIEGPLAEAFIRSLNPENTPHHTANHAQDWEDDVAGTMANLTNFVKQAFKDHPVQREKIGQAALTVLERCEEMAAKAFEHNPSAAKRIKMIGRGFTIAA